jgi:hypothetical protein
MRLESSRRVKHRPQPGLGDVVAGALKAVGVKKHPGCGCHQKQAALNAATPSWLRRLLGRIAPGGRPSSRA